MHKFDAKTAADHIREAFESRSALSPDDHHSHAFARAVCEHLGVEPDAVNLPAVIELLAKHKIAPHLVEGYPKAATREATQNDVAQGHARFVGETIPIYDKDGNPVIYDSPADEPGQKKRPTPKKRPAKTAKRGKK